MERVYRYMGLEEFDLLTSGADLIYTSTKWKRAKSSSEGFCFLNMFTDFTSEDFDGYPTEHTFDPIQCYKFLRGIVEKDGVLVEFAVTPESGLIDSAGIYADPINSDSWDANIGIDEKYTKAYNRDTLIPLRYRLVNGIRIDEKWYNVNIPKAQAILAGIPYEYETNNEKVTIKKYMGSENEEVSVPEKIEGHSVTEIGKYAYANGGLTDVSNVKSIMLPNTIKNIGEGAFWDCTSLKSITIPDSVTEIGQRAFFNCTSLKEITIPEKFKNQLDNIFVGVNLDNVKINYTRDEKTVETVENNKASVIQNGMVSGNKNVPPSTLLSNTRPSSRGRK